MGDLAGISIPIVTELSVDAQHPAQRTIINRGTTLYRSTEHTSKATVLIPTPSRSQCHSASHNKEVDWHPKGGLRYLDVLR